MEAENKIRNLDNILLFWVLAGATYLVLSLVGVLSGLWHPVAVSKLSQFVLPLYLFHKIWRRTVPAPTTKKSTV